MDFTRTILVIAGFYLIDRSRSPSIDPLQFLRGESISLGLEKKDQLLSSRSMDPKNTNETDGWMGKERMSLEKEQLAAQYQQKVSSQVKRARARERGPHIHPLLNRLDSAFLQNMVSREEAPLSPV